MGNLFGKIRAHHPAAFRDRLVSRFAEQRDRISNKLANLCRGRRRLRRPDMAIFVDSQELFILREERCFLIRTKFPRGRATASLLAGSTMKWRISLLNAGI